VRYDHTVTNRSSRAETVNLRVTSLEGWEARIFAADGETALTDTDDDGLVDVGELGPGEAAEIVVQVRLPANAVGGTQDVTTITASMPGTSMTASAQDRTTVNGKLILTISVNEDATSDSSPSIAGSPDTAAGQGVASPTDAGAALITVNVTSTGPWSGGCSVRSSQMTGEETSGPLRWRVRGSSEGWTSFTASSDPTCFSVQEPGSLTRTYEYVTDGPPDEDDDSTPVVVYRATGDGG